jgi:hypothetical protein
MKQEVLDFFNKHKDATYTPPEVPNHLKNDPLKFSRWLLNHPKFAWLELDIKLNLEVWKKEALYAIDSFVNHRANQSHGWKSCCIHGLGIDKTEHWPKYFSKESEVIYDWTQLSDLTPTIKQFWKENFPSESFQRIRFMLLEENGYIEEHSDSKLNAEGEEPEEDMLNGWPINLAIIHPKECFMILENYGIVPFKEGKPILINIRHKHAFLNFTNQKRIHLIASCVFGNKKEEVAKLVYKSFFKDE